MDYDFGQGHTFRGTGSTRTLGSLKKRRSVIKALLRSLLLEYMMSIAPKKTEVIPIQF